MTNFQSDIPFESERIHAAGVYCSDGRFGEQVDDLLHNGLGLPRYDRLVVPGGPALFASNFSSYREEEAAVSQLKFLVEFHALEHVVLVGHESCAYYLHRLKVPELQLPERQIEDMRKAAQHIRDVAPRVEVFGFFARVVASGVRFDPVEL